MKPYAYYSLTPAIHARPFRDIDWGIDNYFDPYLSLGMNLGSGSYDSGPLARISVNLGIGINFSLTNNSKQIFRVLSTYCHYG